MKRSLLIAPLALAFAGAAAFAGIADVAPGDQRDFRNTARVEVSRAAPQSADTYVIERRTGAGNQAAGALSRTEVVTDTIFVTRDRSEAGNHAGQQYP